MSRICASEQSRDLFRVLDQLGGSQVCTAPHHRFRLPSSCKTFRGVSGLGQPAVPLITSLFGTTRLFDDATLSRLYPNHRFYVTAVENSTDAAVRAGFLMPEDGELIKAAAAASRVGNP